MKLNSLLAAAALACAVAGGTAQAEVLRWAAQNDILTLDPHAKHSDRIAATKALCALRGFDEQPEGGQGAVINITLPFQPQQLGRGESRHRQVTGNVMQLRCVLRQLFALFGAASVIP